MHSPVDHVIIDSSLLQQHAGILDFSGGAGARVPVSALGARLYRTFVYVGMISPLAAVDSQTPEAWTKLGRHFAIHTAFTLNRT